MVQCRIILCMTLLKFVGRYPIPASSINTKISYYEKKEYTMSCHVHTVDRATMYYVYNNSKFYSMIQFHNTNVVVEQYHFLDV